MIPLFPYWKFTIHPAINQQQAMARLSRAVAPTQKRFRFWGDIRPQEFTGTFSENEFWIERIIRYRNSFLPTIHGRFLSTETGLQIRISISLNPIALILGVGFSMCALPFLISLVYRFLILGHVDPALKTPLLLITFLYLLFTGGFAFEAVIARRLLNRIFEHKQT